MNARNNTDIDAENTIRAVRRRREPAAADSARAGVDMARALDDVKGTRRTRNAHGPGGTDPSGAMPQEIWQRFIGIGSRYYFPDGAPAFTDRGTKLTTPSENTEVVRTLVAIAQVRGWDRIAVTGSERFRKEAWFAAQRAGLDVRGYRASDVERAQLARSLAKHDAALNAPESHAREREGSLRRRDAHARRGRDAAHGKTVAARPPRGETFVGRLLEHGHDTYRHEPLQQSSYYVRLQTKEGEREIWGVDLERAVRQSLSAAKIGDEVIVRAVDRRPVTVPARRRDADGREIAAASLSTHRNSWIVERSDFLAARARAATIFRDPDVAPQEAVKRHPELQGSYLKLQAVKLGAERDLKDPRERARLVTRARALIAESIERGEPLDPVRLREQGARQPATERAVRRELEQSR